MNADKMSCCGGNMRTRRILTLLLGIAGLAFVALLFLKNPMISLSLLVIPSLLFCPIACGAMGGLIWFITRHSKSKEMTKHE